jgi:hypothetical protein
MNRLFFLMGVFLVTMAMTGCGVTGKNDLPASQTIVVTLDGSPASNLNLSFVNAAKSVAGSGGTNKEGKASVRGTDGKKLAAGPYTIVVSELGEEENPMVAQKAPAKNRIPAAMSNATTSKVTLTIEDGKWDYTLDIKTK